MTFRFENEYGIFLKFFNKNIKLKSFKNYLAICAIIKNEAPYLKEWIEYHKLIGVEKFYLYDNESTDNTKQLLQPYIQSGLVEYNFIKGTQKQIPVYKKSVKKHKYDSFWIAYIDADEFIVPLNPKNLKNFLQNYEQYGGVGINWCIYGSSNHDKKPDGLVIKNFKYRANNDFHDNKHIKTIANPRKIKKFRNPHQIICIPPHKIVSPDFKVLTGFYNEDINYEKIRINHYYTKSREEFLIKISKGKADSKGEKNINLFYANDKNDIYDNIMDEYIDLMERKQ